MPKKRVSVYIDGFNLYHSSLQHLHPEYRWLDLRALSGRFINPANEELKDVYYFSALAEWLPEKAKKHLLYIKALKTTGVKVVLGKFTEKDKKCPLCHNSYKTHEEKKTDINIAITLLTDGFRDQFDTALIMSGDSDLAPVTTKLKAICPAKKIGIIIPQRQFAVSLKENADYYKKIQNKDLSKSLLPAQLMYNGKPVNAPALWLPAHTQ